jgi:uncharacterized protein YihD (DUF1040 family)
LSLYKGTTSQLLAKGASFTFEVTNGTDNQMWFKVRLKMRNATTSDLLVGLQRDVTLPFANNYTANGVFFVKRNKTATANLTVRTSTSVKHVAACPIAMDKWVSMAWYFDGVKEYKAYCNGTHYGTINTAGIPKGNMTPIIVVKQVAYDSSGTYGNASAYLDYIYVAKERRPVN